MKSFGVKNPSNKLELSNAIDSKCASHETTEISDYKSNYDSISVTFGLKLGHFSTNGSFGEHDSGDERVVH